jgi:hypothetical protein
MVRRTLVCSSLLLLLLAVSRCVVDDDDATCGPQGPCASGYECVDDPYAGWECAPLACNNCPVGGGCEWDNDGNVICLYPDGGEVPEDAGTDATAPDAESNDGSTVDASAVDSGATVDAALDGGAIDATPDAATDDASPADGGPLDSGIDASVGSDAGSTGTDAATD